MNLRLSISGHITIFLALLVMAMVSCRNNTASDALPAPLTFAPPVVEPLKLSKPQKIDWANIKSTPVHPLVKKFDLNTLPLKNYADPGFKPFTHPIEKIKIDFSALPEKDLDIDKLPSKPLKFKSYKLPMPKLVAKGLMRLKDTALSMYELDRSLGFYGEKGVFPIMKDHNGFLWFGTLQAVYRYDGENIKLFIPGIAGHYISGMLEDSQGRIWIITADNGVEVFDPVTGILDKTTSSPGLGSQNCAQIVLDKQNRIWISGFDPGGVNIIDTKTQTVKWLNQTAGLSDPKEATGMMLDDRNNMWIATWKGINIIDLQNKKIRYFDKRQGLKSDSADRVMQDRKGNMYITFKHGLINILNAAKDTLRTISEPPAPKEYSYGTQAFTIIQDSEGKVWIATNDNGVMVIDPEKQTALHLLQNYPTGENFVKKVIEDNNGGIWIASQTGLYMISHKKAIVEQIGKVSTTTMTEDREGLIWQGTFYTGVNIIDRRNKTIRTFDVTHGLGNDTMTNFKVMGGRLFIGDVKGLDIIDSPMRHIPHIGSETGLSNKLIDAYVIDRRGRLWLGGTDSGIDVYDEHAGTLKHLGKEQGLKDLVVNDMCIDTRGRIWISTASGGIHIIDPDTGAIQYITNTSLAQGQPVLQPDDSGNVWIGDRNGVHVADIKNKKLTLLSTAQGLFDETVNSLLRDRGRLYASTNKGISIIAPPVDLYSGKKWQVESYGINKTQLGYATDLITKDGLYLWGDAGITALDLSIKERTNALPYIAGINIMDDPKYFTSKNYTFSDGISWDRVEKLNNLPVDLHLPYDQNYVQFQFGTINLGNRDTTWYTYKLTGKDKDWSAKTTSTSSRNYFNLAPGDYTFEVTSLKYDRSWSKPAIFSFIINPPWWQTWWAYVLYVGLLGGSIWGFSHYRSLQLIKDKRILEHKVHIRTEEVMQQKEEIEAQRDDLEKAFSELKTTQTQLIQSEKMASLGELTAGIAHEIQNPLNFVNNFSDVNREMLEELEEELNKGDIEEAKAIAADIRENEQKINHHGKRADAIVKGMLQHSRAGSGVKEPTNINALVDEYMRLSYHGLRAKDKSFNAEMLTHLDESLPKINVIPQDIGRVLLNLFNNAFYAVNEKAKTAGANYKPEVSVTTSAESAQVIIKVKDNGIGIPDAVKEKIMQPFFTTKPTGEGTGLGLSLTYDMVVKGHGGSIQVNSKEGEGSEFIIQLPVKNI
ncbi:MAG: two-component regulator propeller domain-containing protein [Mucilaginibacter sp.]